MTKYMNKIDNIINELREGTEFTFSETTTEKIVISNVKNGEGTKELTLRGGMIRRQHAENILLRGIQCIGIKSNAGLFGNRVVEKIASLENLSDMMHFVADSNIEQSKLNRYFATFLRLINEMPLFTDEQCLDAFYAICQSEIKTAKNSKRINAELLSERFEQVKEFNASIVEKLKANEEAAAAAAV